MVKRGRKRRGREREREGRKFWVSLSLLLDLAAWLVGLSVDLALLRRKGRRIEH